MNDPRIDQNAEQPDQNDLEENERRYREFEETINQDLSAYLEWLEMTQGT